MPEKKYYRTIVTWFTAVKKLKWIFFIVFVVGLITLVFPDNGRPVFSLNSIHGPSSQDLFGLILIFFAWAYSCIIIFKERQNIVEKMGRIKVSLLIVAYCLSITAVAAGLLISNEIILWVSVFIASLINTLFVAVAFATKK